MTRRGQLVLVAAAVAALALVDDAAERATGQPWSERTSAVREFRAALGPRVDALERSRLGDAVAVRVAENATAAASVTCPGGPGRAFGGCERDGGAVVQERANETVVVALAVDVRVTTPGGTARFVRVVRPN